MMLCIVNNNNHTLFFPTIPDIWEFVDMEGDDGEDGGFAIIYHTPTDSPEWTCCGDDGCPLTEGHCNNNGTWIRPEEDYWPDENWIDKILGVIRTNPMFQWLRDMCDPDDIIFARKDN
jgi:hypothetical protein